MAVPLHIRVREWFADASGQQLPHIRAVPRGAKRSSPPFLSWENPMPGHMRAAIAILSLVVAIGAAGLLVSLLFGVYVLVT
jgi:hypothetical protein